MRLTLLFALVATLSLAQAVPTPPNVILILTDNQGDWTLGCYGNKDIRTPHIDRLAREGTRFANAYANNPVCSPNRATLLTGLMPSQHGVHCFLTNGAPQMGDGAYSTIAEFTSLGEIFQAAGYATGMVGKWHLGANAQPQEGFTDAWITMPAGHTATFFDAQVIEDGTTRSEPGHLTHLWQKHAVDFIRKDHAGRPFFLYLPFNGPYGLGKAQLTDHERAPHWQDYASATLPSFPRRDMHPWQFHNKDYLNNDTCIRRYAAELTTVDDAVGAVLAALEERHLSQNTLIIFAGDNGWSGGQHGLWGMGDHTQPKCAFEPTMRVPLIWWQPGRIKPQVFQPAVSHIDFFPSLLAHLQFHPKLPTIQKLTGHDYSPALTGKAIPDWQHPVFYEFEELRSIRTATHKLILRHQGEVQELYDLTSDPEEQHNLYDQPQAATIQAQLSQQLHTYFDQTATPEFNLWAQGRSKARLLAQPKP
jgi:arylsulfatase A-like enzyme